MGQQAEKQEFRRYATSVNIALFNTLIPFILFIWVMVIKSFYSENLLNVLPDNAAILYFFENISIVILVYAGLMSIIFIATLMGYHILVINRFIIYVSFIVYLILTLIIYINKYPRKIDDLLTTLDSASWYQSLEPVDQTSVKRVFSCLKPFFIFILVACILQFLYAIYTTYLFKKCMCING
jgi:hypothetical protein